MSATTGSNVPAETILYWTHELSRSKRAVDEATSLHRNRVKKAKTDGVTTDAILESIAWSRLDADERRRRIIDRIRVESVRYPDSGSIFSDTLPSLDVRVSERMRYTDTLFDAETKGYQHGRSGVAIDENPYQAGSELAVVWHREWSRGSTARAKEEEEGGGQSGDATRRVHGRAAQPSMLPETQAAQPARKRSGGRPKGSKNRKKRSDAGRKKAPRKMSNVAQLRPAEDAA
jgi:ribosome modulation factor